MMDSTLKSLFYPEPGDTIGVARKYKMKAGERLEGSEWVYIGRRKNKDGIMFSCFEYRPE